MTDDDILAALDFHHACAGEGCDDAAINWGIMPCCETVRGVCDHHKQKYLCVIADIRGSGRPLRCPICHTPDVTLTWP